MERNKGITLIALVITIVVLIILAGVAINMLSGNNGILRQAMSAKEKTEISGIIEEIRLDIMAKQSENNGKIDDEQLDEILERYGTISVDGSLLTTNKGNYDILVSDIYDIETENLFYSNTTDLMFKDNILSIKSNDKIRNFNIISVNSNYLEIERKINMDSQYKISLLGDDDSSIYLLFHPGQGIKVFELKEDKVKEIYTIVSYNKLPTYVGNSRFKFCLEDDRYLKIYLLENKEWNDFYTVDINDVKTKTGFDGNINFGLLLFRSEIEQNIQFSIYNNTIDSKYYCKSISFLGDSITGINLEGYEKYPGLVTTKLGAICNAYGYGGSSLSGGENNIPSFVERFTDENSDNYQKVPQNSDIILVFGGNNGDRNLGNIGDSTSDTTYGAIKILIEYFLENYQDSKLIFATPIQGVEYSQAKVQRAQAIKDVCGEYNIPVIDLYNNSGITVENASEYLKDGVHPNDDGNRLIANYICKELLK